jgi:hypothetical protein
VENMELIGYNIKKIKTIVKQTQRKRRIDLDNIVICTTKEKVLETERNKLIELLSRWIIHYTCHLIQSLIKGNRYIKS